MQSFSNSWQLVTGQISLSSMLNHVVTWLPTCTKEGDGFCGKTNS